MRQRFTPGLLTVILLAGCVGADPVTDAQEDAPAAPTPGPAAQEGTAAGDANGSATPSSPPGLVSRAISLEGRTGTQLLACAAAPVDRCAFLPADRGERDVLLEEVAGRVAGGLLTLEWTAEDPATQRLSFGVMQMGGEGDCASLDLGMVAGPSPLVLEVATAERAVCPGELVHVWVSGDAYGSAGPAYYQADLDQAFRLDGVLLLEPLPRG